MRRNAGTDAAPSNLFTDGDPGVPTPASVLGSDWLNILQEEVAHVIEHAGLTIDQANPYATNTKTQLRQAIQILSSAGAGGGMGASWQENPGDAPTSVEENGGVLYLFEPGSSSKLNLFLKVPEGYVAGRQITAKIGHYSPTATLTQLLKAQATLVRDGTDAFDSTTNQRTTTNTALTNTVAKQLRITTLDLTDSSGQINGVAVSTGDMIKVSLYRDTDTDTADIRFIPSLTEVRY